jgi:drug/metabolite transporter (DMT)-like permease
MTVISWLVVATFLSAHLSFYSSLISLPYLLFSKNLLNLSFIIYGIAFLYFSYCLYRLGKSHRIRRPMLRAITASLLSVAMWGALTMGFGMGLSFYSMSYTPSFIKKVEKVETIEP